jgi:hypothetical protein
MKSGLPEDILNHRVNCVFRHHVCPTGQFHTPGAGSLADSLSCYKQILFIEGDEALDNWISEVKQYTIVVGAEAEGKLLAVRDMYKSECIPIEDALEIPPSWINKKMKERR